MPYLPNTGLLDRFATGLTAISSTFVGFLNTLPWAVYHSSPTTRTNGQGGPLETDDTGRLKVDVGTATISGTLTSDQGAAGVSSWKTIDDNSAAIKNSVAAIPAKGTAAMAGSTPVTIATDDAQFGKFPSAAAVADAATNATSVTQVGARVVGYNGATWDMLRSGLTSVTSTLTGFLNTLPWAVYHTTPSTRTDGQGGPMEADSLGNLSVSQATKLAGEDLANDVMKVEQQFSYLNITLAAPTTTTVKSGAGMLHLIQINKAAANAVITIYDNTAGSGTVIATITQPAAVLASQITMLYDVKFSTGLTLVTSAAAQDITVAYR